MIRSLIAAALGVGEIILIIVCAAIVIGVVIAAIIRKKQGKTSCGGDCSACGSCPHCQPQDKNK